LGKKLHRLCSVVGCIERMQRRRWLLRNFAAVNEGKSTMGISLVIFGGQLNSQT